MNSVSKNPDFGGCKYALIHRCPLDDCGLLVRGAVSGRLYIMFLVGELFLCFGFVFHRLSEVELEAMVQVDLGVPSVLYLVS